MEEFLKNLQESVESGEKNDDIINHLNEIGKRADGVTSEMVEDQCKRSAKIKPELNKKEREKAQEEYTKLIVEQKENDEKLRFLANIESRNSQIRTLKDEFETLKIDYGKKIENIHDQKINLMAEFEKKYGKKAEDEYDFGPEPDTTIE
jgi:hypothetical protein